MKTPPHTVIYTHGAGRLGNQVIRFAHWIAWAQLHPGEVEVCDFAFWPYAEYFLTWREHPGCVFPVRSGGADRLARWRMALPRGLRALGETRSRLQRVVQAAGHWWPGSQAVALDVERDERIDLDDPAFVARIRQRPVTMCCGWKIDTWPQVAAHEAALREFFRPAPEIARLAADFIGRLRRQHDVVVGLFIRQSDYREWQGGRFYFSTEQYAVWIRQLLDLHPGRRLAVVVASETWQDPALFAGLPCHFASGAQNAGGHWFESWVELSLCDFVVSPPSTFSATAAFLGGVPLWPVVAADQALDRSQVIHEGLAGAARHPIFSLSVK